MEIGRNRAKLKGSRACCRPIGGATARSPGGVYMTTIVLNRRNLLAAGGTVLLATGVPGLLLPAQAQGIAPTPSMSGGSNNYRKGAAIVDRIGKGGFWMSGTVRRAGDGAPLAGQASRFGRTRPKGRSMSRKVMEPRLPTRTGRSVLRCRRLFPSLANRMVTSPMTAVNSKPSFYVP